LMLPGTAAMIQSARHPLHRKRDASTNSANENHFCLEA
jgi:hypothetical protein